LITQVIILFLNLSKNYIFQNFKIFLFAANGKNAFSHLSLIIRRIKNQKTETKIIVMKNN